MKLSLDYQTLKYLLPLIVQTNLVSSASKECCRNNPAGPKLRPDVLRCNPQLAPAGYIADWWSPTDEFANFKYPSGQADALTACDSADIYITLDGSLSFRRDGFEKTLNMIKDMIKKTLDGDRVRYTSITWDGEMDKWTPGKPTSDEAQLMKAMDLHKAHYCDESLTYACATSCGAYVIRQTYSAYPNWPRFHVNPEFQLHSGRFFQVLSVDFFVLV